MEQQGYEAHVECEMIRSSMAGGVNAEGYTWIMQRRLLIRNKSGSRGVWFIGSVCTARPPQNIACCVRHAPFLLPSFFRHTPQARNPESSTLAPNSNRQ
jgi:hypothetical protein